MGPREIHALKKFLNKQLSSNFEKNNKKYSRTVGLTREAFAIDISRSNDCLYL